MATDHLLKIMSAIALRPIMINFAKAYEAQNAQALQLHFDTNPRIARCVQRGDDFDVVLLNRRLLTQLIEEGRIDPATLFAIGCSPMGIGGHPTAHPLDVSTAEKFVDFLEGARSVGYTPQGSSGERLLQIISTLHLDTAVQGKLVAVEGGDAGRAVSDGEVEFCIVPITTILASNAKLLAVLPTSLDATITFYGAVGTRASKGNDGMSFLKALTDPGLDQVLEKQGIRRPIPD